MPYAVEFAPLYFILTAWIIQDERQYWATRDTYEELE